jgi:hypothetical protein
LHQTGKLHRDTAFKHSVTREGRVVILDLAWCRRRSQSAARQWLLAGNFDYMSPEQGAQYPLSKASDWYSVE